MIRFEGRGLFLLALAAACESGAHSGARDFVAEAGVSGDADAATAHASGGSSNGTGGSGGTTAASGGSGGTTTASGGSTSASGGASGIIDARAPESGASELVGWAAVLGDGVESTTGGIAGAIVSPASADELIEYAESEEPLVIEIRGRFSVPRLQVSSNKTLVGIGPEALIEGGVRVRGDEGAHVENVVIQNLRIDGKSSDADGDALQIYYAHHVWVDHCEIWDAPDGNLDIVHAANWVTISWTKFRYTSAAPAPDHRFCNLIGHSDGNESEDAGRLKVTFHHNWWAEGVIERMPRVRFGDVHVFANYYSAAGNNYAIGAGREARLLIENNFFEGVDDPHVFYDGEPTAQIVARGNVYEATSGLEESGQGNAFDPPYPYELDPAEEVPDRVMMGTGPR